MRAIVLLPLTLIYSFISIIWDLYWRTRTPAKVPAWVISIGNLTAGGSGKTTIAGYLARKALAHGKKVAVVARGYRRRGSDPVIVKSDTEFSWEECGDEPLALAKMIPGLAVYVNSDKTKAAMKATTDGNEIIIVDDGFQHRQLCRDVNVVCLDSKEPFGNGFLLPSGTLREPKRALKRADAIILVGESFEPTTRQLMFPNDIPVFNARKIVTGVKTLSGESTNILGKRVIGFCGLANPHSFRNSLAQCGCELVEFLEFGDHHSYTPRDLRKIASRFGGTDLFAAVTTLKDAVKLERIWPEAVPLFFLEISIHIENEEHLRRLVGI